MVADIVLFDPVKWQQQNFRRNRGQSCLQYAYASGTLVFQFNGIITESLSGTVPLLGTKTSIDTDPKDARTAGRNSVNGLSVNISGATPSLSLDF